MPFPPAPSVLVCDLDGVVWLADEPIPGAAEAIAAFRARGGRVLFVSNNSFSPTSAVEQKLERFGIPARGDVLTSAMAAAHLVPEGATVLVCGGPGIVEAVERRGATAVREGPADVVIVGWHRDFDYERLRVAATAVRAGAVLIGTNEDATYPTPEGPIPGGGALLAAVAVASGARPAVAGKPHPPMAQLVRATLGLGPEDDAASLLMVGDRPETDGLFSVALGCRFALVLSGVTRPEDLPVEPNPDVVVSDLAALVASYA